MSKNIHVTPHPNGDWQVKRDKAERASHITPTQREGFDKAREIAKREGLEVCIHRPNGQIRDKHSYGKDPYPPRG